MARQFINQRTIKELIFPANLHTVGQKHSFVRRQIIIGQPEEKFRNSKELSVLSGGGIFDALNGRWTIFAQGPGKQIMC